MAFCRADWPPIGCNARHIWRSVFDSRGLDVEAERQVASMVAQLRRDAEHRGGDFELVSEIETDRLGGHGHRQFRRGHAPREHRAIILHADDHGDHDLDKIELHRGHLQSQGLGARREVLLLLDDKH